MRNVRLVALVALVGVGCGEADPLDAGVDASLDAGRSPPEAPTRFEIGEAIEGAIWTSGGDNHDYDRFVVTLESGTVVEVELAYADPSLDLEVTLRSTWTPVLPPAIPRPEVSADLGRDQRRQVFVPYDGEYVVTVNDARAGESDSAPYGGAHATYVLHTRVVSPLPIRDELLLDELAGELGDDDVAIHMFTADEALDALVPLDGECHGMSLVVSSPQSGLVLWSYDPGSSVPLVRRSGYCPDDAPGSPGPVGVQMCTRACPGRETWIVVQAVEDLVDRRYTLEAEVDGARELDVGGVLGGVISSIDAALFEGDEFELLASPEQRVRIEVTAAGLDLQPVVEAYFGTGELGGITRWSAGMARSEGPTAVMELTNTPRAGWTIRVDDARNVPEDGSAPAHVGGSTFTYTIRATEVTWTPSASALPLSTAAAVPQGSYAWYSVHQPPQSAVFVRTTSTGDRAVVRPIDDLLYAFEPSAPGTETTRAFFHSPSVPVERSLVFGVRHARFLSATIDVSALLFEFRSPPLGRASEVEPNDTLALAQRVTPDMVVSGATTGTSEADRQPDLYAVHLNPGDTLMVYLQRDAGRGVMRLLDAAGALVTDGIHYDGAASEILGTALFHYAVTGGDFVAEITPECGPTSCHNDTYGATFMVR